MCEAVDRVTVFENESFPQAINCWNCHAGFNLPIGGMINEAKGMFPTRELDGRGNVAKAHLN